MRGSVLLEHDARDVRLVVRMRLLFCITQTVYILCGAPVRVQVQRFLRAGQTVWCSMYAASPSLTRANDEDRELRRMRFAVGSWFFHVKSPEIIDGLWSYSQPVLRLLQQSSSIHCRGALGPPSPTRAACQKGRLDNGDEGNDAVCGPQMSQSISHEMHSSTPSFSTLLAGSPMAWLPRTPRVFVQRR